MAKRSRLRMDNDRRRRTNPRGKKRLSGSRRQRIFLSVDFRPQMGGLKGCPQGNSMINPLAKVPWLNWAFSRIILRRGFPYGLYGPPHRFIFLTYSRARDMT